MTLVYRMALNIFTLWKTKEKSYEISISNDLEILICFNENINYFKSSAD